MFYKCLNENGFDYKQCEVHQMNSKKCKDFWVKLIISNSSKSALSLYFIKSYQYRVQRDRMGKGIRPYMPDIDERIRIKQEYLQKKKEHCAANNKK